MGVRAAPEIVSGRIVAGVPAPRLPLEKTAQQRKVAQPRADRCIPTFSPCLFAQDASLDGRNWATCGDFVATPAKLELDLARRLTAIAEPGRRRIYSNTGFELAQELFDVVEQAVKAS